jgi:catechol 2,3-dioxygenase-like lactoylglutathione lyase family enzyme
MASALRALAKAPVAALGKPGARAQSLATAAVGAGRVARFTFEVADTAKSAKFYTDALGLRLAPQAAPQRVVAGDGLGLCADVVMLQAGGSSAAAARAAAASGLDGLEFGDSEEDPLIHPFLTIGVSNLKTSARHAKRQFGAVGAWRGKRRRGCGRPVCEDCLRCALRPQRSPSACLFPCASAPTPPPPPRSGGAARAAAR